MLQKRRNHALKRNFLEITMLSQQNIAATFKLAPIVNTFCDRTCSPMLSNLNGRRRSWSLKFMHF